MPSSSTISFLGGCLPALLYPFWGDAFQLYYILFGGMPSSSTIPFLGGCLLALLYLKSLDNLHNSDIIFRPRLPVAEQTFPPKKGGIITFALRTVSVTSYPVSLSAQILPCASPDTPHQDTTHLIF